MSAVARPPEMPTEVNVRIGFLLSRLGSSARDAFGAALAPLGIRPNQYGALVLVQRHQPTSQQTLASGLGVDRSLVVGIVDHLEALGALERRPDLDDRRRHALHLTIAGGELITKCNAIAQDLQDRRLAPLKPQQRSDLLTLLTVLAKHDVARVAVDARRDPLARSMA